MKAARRSLAPDATAGSPPSLPPAGTRPGTGGALRAVLGHELARTTQTNYRGQWQHFRAWVADQGLRAGIELPLLMNAGRWRSPAMPAHYTRNETAAKGAVAQFYGYTRQGA